MRIETRTALPLTLAIAAAACSSLPERVEHVERARASIEEVSREPLAGRVASEQLAAARDALAAADEALEERQPLPLIEHRAYVAQRYADISRELVSEARAREEVGRADAERNRIIAESRERQAEAAQRELEVQTRIAAEQAQAAQEAEQRAQDLERELEQLEARDTDRGLVLTLGEILFETGQATLTPGSMTTIDRLAQFMRDYPERSVRIEGHTDAAGDDAANQALSERRASAVESELMARGIDSARIATAGYGETRPIASNDSAAGRLQNRRIEIVLSDEQGAFAADGPRAQVE
jgi:outer membrane protein OmpA-like peptidoglycan-associated protein